MASPDGLHMEIDFNKSDPLSDGTNNEIGVKFKKNLKIMGASAFGFLFLLIIILAISLSGGAAPAIAQPPAPTPPPTVNACAGNPCEGIGSKCNAHLKGGYSCNCAKATHTASDDGKHCCTDRPDCSGKVLFSWGGAGKACTVLNAGTLCGNAAAATTAPAAGTPSGAATTGGTTTAGTPSGAATTPFVRGGAEQCTPKVFQAYNLPVPSCLIGQSCEILLVNGRPSHTCEASAGSGGPCAQKEEANSRGKKVGPCGHHNGYALGTCTPTADNKDYTCTCDWNMGVTVTADKKHCCADAHCYMVNGKVQPMFGYQSMDAYSDIVSYTWSGDWQKCGGICGSQAPTPAPPPTAAPTSDPYLTDPHVCEAAIFIADNMVVPKCAVGESCEILIVGGMPQHTCEPIAGICAKKVEASSRGKKVGPCGHHNGYALGTCTASADGKDYTCTCDWNMGVTVTWDKKHCCADGHCYVVNGVGKPLHGAAAQSMASYADILTYNYTGDWTNCGGTCPSTPAPTAPSQAPTPANPCTSNGVNPCGAYGSCTVVTSDYSSMGFGYGASYGGQDYQCHCSAGYTHTEDKRHCCATTLNGACPAGKELRFTWDGTKDSNQCTPMCHQHLVSAAPTSVPTAPPTMMTCEADQDCTAGNPLMHLSCDGMTQLCTCASGYTGPLAAGCPSFSCTHGGVIAHSDRDSSNTCSPHLGDKQCAFTCDGVPGQGEPGGDGSFAWGNQGKHKCDPLTATFSGGSCQRCNFPFPDCSITGRSHETVTCKNTNTGGQPVIMTCTATITDRGSFVGKTLQWKCTPSCDAGFAPKFKSTGTRDQFDAGFSCQETHTSVSGGDVECVDIDECHGPAGNPCGTEVCHNMTGGSPGFKCGGKCDVSKGLVSNGTACVPTTCAAATLPNAVSKCDAAKFGEPCTPTCMPGFKVFTATGATPSFVNPAVNPTCGANGLFGGGKGCEKIKCNAADAGLPLPHSTNDKPCFGAYGDVCSFSCKDGYTQRGSRVCGSDGRFTGGTCAGGCKMSELQALLPGGTSFMASKGEMVIDTSVTTDHCVAQLGVSQHLYGADAGCTLTCKLPQANPMEAVARYTCGVDGKWVGTRPACNSPSTDAPTTTPTTHAPTSTPTTSAVCTPNPCTNGTKTRCERFYNGPGTKETHICVDPTNQCATDPCGKAPNGYPYGKCNELSKGGYMCVCDYHLGMSATTDQKHCCADNAGQTCIGGKVLYDWVQGGDKDSCKVTCATGTAPTMIPTYVPTSQAPTTPTTAPTTICASNPCKNGETCEVLWNYDKVSYVCEKPDDGPCKTKVEATSRGKKVGPCGHHNGYALGKCASNGPGDYKCACDWNMGTHATSDGHHCCSSGVDCTNPTATKTWEWVPGGTFETCKVICIAKVPTSKPTSAAPTAPTMSPTVGPTFPTPVPTTAPTTVAPTTPTSAPSVGPTTPTTNPTPQPTTNPTTHTPSVAPTTNPTSGKDQRASLFTMQPSMPTNAPTTKTPTVLTTVEPTAPSAAPTTGKPTTTGPTAAPTSVPTATPSAAPSASPTHAGCSDANLVHHQQAYEGSNMGVVPDPKCVSTTAQTRSHGTSCTFTCEAARNNPATQEVKCQDGKWTEVKKTTGDGVSAGQFACTQFSNHTTTGFGR